ncbi:MAG: hypothetical protein KF771_06435 [Burkholderiales bacterium]|nr:hypothetical protein [Burkholderiales bacterium]
MPATRSIPKPHAEPSPVMNGTAHAAIVLSLMSHQLRKPCPLLIRAIAGRLACLSQACGDGSAEALHRLADVLLPQWRNIPFSVRS